MGYEITWLVENRVVYVRTFGKMTLAEVRKMGDEAMALCRAGTPLVHVLSEATEQEGVDLKLQDVMSMFRGTPALANVGWSVYVGPSALDRFFFTIINQLAKSQNRTFTNMVEAIEFLQKVDETLPPIPTPRRTKQGNV